MAEPTYELYDGDPDNGGTKVAELRYDLTDDIVILRHESAGVEAQLDGDGLDVFKFIVGGNWVLDSESESGVERLRIQGVGADDPIELFLQAKGTSNVARFTVTPDSSVSDFSGMTFETDGTQQIIDSIAEGTASLLPIILRMGGTDIIEITTGGLVRFSNISGTPTMSGHDHTAAGMTAIPTGGILNGAVTEPKLNAADSPTSGEVLSYNGSQFEWVENVVEKVVYEVGHVNWPTTSAFSEIHRFDLQSGEMFNLERIEFRQKGGGSSTSATLRVFDNAAGAAIDSVTLGSTSTAGGSSNSGAIILVEIDNQTGSAVNAAPIVRGYIV